MITPAPPLIILIFLARFITFFIGTPLLITAIAFLGKGSMHSNAWLLVLSVALSLLLVGWQMTKAYQISGGGVILYLLAGLLVIGLFTFATSKVYDKSWDGLTYHQMAVLELVDGWNSFYEKLPDASLRSEYTGRTENMNLYVNHYTKGSEVFAATIIGATGDIESGKVFNVLLLLSAFCSVLYLLSRLRLFNAFWNVAISIAAAFSPIVVNQTFSYLVDGALSSVLLMLLCCLILLFIPDEDRRGVYMHMFFLVILLVNLKFTGAAYLACFSLTFALVSAYRRKQVVLKEFLIVTALSTVVGVCLVGFNPYITNLTDRGHPLYPIAGDDKINVMASVMPVEFRKDPSFIKFVKSTFSTCDNFDSVQPHRMVSYKLPFTVTLKEIKTFQSEMTRLSGFGVLWSGILCLTLVCALALFATLPRRWLVYFAILTAATIVSVAINPESWWARLVPQLWFFPLITAVFLMMSRSKSQRLLGRTTVILMILNALIVASAYTYSTVVQTVRANECFEKLQNSKKPVVVYFDIFRPNIRKFEERGIRFVRVPDVASLPCASKVSFLNIRLCFADVGHFVKH